MSAQPMEVRMAHLEGAYEQISQRLNGIDGRLTALDQKIDARFDAFDAKIEARFQGVDGKFEGMNRRFENLDKKLTTAIIAGFTIYAATLATVLGAFVAGHH